MHRVVEKLLHTPTVRVKELAGEPGGSAYAEALRELFDLDLGRAWHAAERRPRSRRRQARRELQEGAGMDRR